MSEINKSNDLSLLNARQETLSENVWIVGVSKTHPGLKYYFNPVTGVSLWNISREDMERAKQTMRADQNEQPVNVSYPEPNEPPPDKKSSTNRAPQTYESIVCELQSINSGLDKQVPGFQCDIGSRAANTSANVVTVNLPACPHSTCNSTLDNTCSTIPLNQTQSTSSLFETATSEYNIGNKNLDHLAGSKRSPNNNISQIIGHTADPSSEKLHNQSNINNDPFNHTKVNFEDLDLTSLKMFAKAGLNMERWYIIADANVYLHHITLIKPVVNSDKQCRLMVPHNVKIELEIATKSQDLRTKAHYACYYIYKMFDSGIVEIDKGNSYHTQDRSNEEYILDCCSKLKEKNFYVIVISNDIELQKYRNKIFIPIFTVTELKEYIYKSNNYSSTTKSPEPMFNSSQSNKNNKVSTANQSNSHQDVNLTSITNPDVTLKPINEAQVQPFYNVPKRTVDVEVQTNFHHLQLDNESRETHSSSPSSCKRIKLRRRKLLQNRGSIPNMNNAISSTPVNKELGTQNKKITANESPKPIEVMSSNNLEENCTIPNNNLKSVGSVLRPIRENTENKNVMFEVTSEMMDQSLRRKCDEWVSRFVQIMEEALTQVLRKNTFLYLPPPWNMYEAAICIEKQFQTDEDVADASKKFLNILNRICDEKGNINASITPTQYMQMYSYGVYVIDTLQGIFTTCEDLQSAAESLSKLLNDIHDLESDVINLEEHRINDTENDENVEVLMIVDKEPIYIEDSNENTAESVPNVYESVTSNHGVSNDNIERCKNVPTLQITFNNTKFSNSRNTNKSSKQHIKTRNTECKESLQADNNAIFSKSINTCKTGDVTSPSKYNLRSKGMRISSGKQDNQPLIEEFIDNKLTRNDLYKSKFLSNFMLQKCREEENADNLDDSFGKNITNEDHRHEEESFSCPNYNVECSNTFDSPTPKLSDKSNVNSNVPKVIRNFVICSEYEDRLRSSRVHDELEELDFEEELLATQYINVDSSSEGTGRLEIDELQYQDDFAENTLIEQRVKNTPEYIKIDFKYFMRIIAQEIKELSLEVFNFSRNTCEAFHSSPAFRDTKSIREKAEKLLFCVDKICKTLINILNRDKNSGYNIQALVKHSEFDISVDKDQIKAYGAFITRCMEQARVLNNIIKDVLSVVYEH